MGFEYLRGRKFYNSLGHLVTLLPPCTSKYITASSHCLKPQSSSHCDEMSLIYINWKSVPYFVSLSVQVSHQYLKLQIQP